MASSNGLRIGEIVLLEFPYTNQAKSKLRPAVILSQSSGKFSDLTVEYMTSEVEKYCEDDASVVIEPTDLESGIIRKTSVIRVDKTLVIDSRNVKRACVVQLSKAKVDEMLRSWARIMVKSHNKAVHTSARKKFTPGDRINYAGRVYDEKEMINLVDSALDFSLTTGKYAEKFEKKFARFLGGRNCSLVNSGSSANLVAFMALSSPKLGDRRVKKADEVITVAAAFPTTVAPIIQHGAIPVFVDIKVPSYNIDCTQLESTLSEKTKAVMLAHTLGNPFDLKKVKKFCQKNNLWLIEDNCDALFCFS